MGQFVGLYLVYVLQYSFFTFYIQSVNCLSSFFQRKTYSSQALPSLASKATEAIGPQVPAG
jgi:hypothetical protein